MATLPACNEGQAAAHWVTIWSTESIPSDASSRIRPLLVDAVRLSLSEEAARAFVEVKLWLWRERFG